RACVGGAAWAARRDAGSVAHDASRIRSCGGSRHSKNDDSDADRRGPLSGCLPSAHRAVLHAIERALLRPRVACRRALGAGAVPRSAATGTAVPTMVDVELLRPWMLLFLPLALLPLLRSRQEALGYSYVAWIPRDSLGRAVEIAAVACAVVAIASTVVGLAGPGRPGWRGRRAGRGAGLRA